MNAINATHQRNFSDSDVFYEDSNEGSYEGYRNKNLPEGYTAYRETGQVGELVYDRYSSVYSSQSLQKNKLCSLARIFTCHKIGWLLNF